MKLIVETDIGGDPDDLFAILYLISAGVDIKLITISPGDPKQIAIVRFLLSECGLSNTKVGVGKPNRNCTRSRDIHSKLLHHYGVSEIALADGLGGDLIASCMDDDPDCQLFCCGPLNSVGDFLRKYDMNTILSNRATMQGGFIGYDVHKSPCKHLKKFENKDTCATFNLNGDVQSALLFIDSATKRSFVPKNVCHTIVYDRLIHQSVMAVKPKNRASELFREAMSMYLSKHSEKKFHDPTAAVCHLHPEIGTWVKGRLYRTKGEWGTQLDENGDDILVDIDRDTLWHYITEGE